MSTASSPQPFTGFEVHSFNDGSAVIVADKWHATALHRAWNTSASETEVEGLSYDRDLYKKMSSEIDNIQALPTAEQMTAEQTSELESSGPAKSTSSRRR